MKSGCAGAVTVVVGARTWYSEEGARYALVEVRYTGASSGPAAECVRTYWRRGALPEGTRLS